MIFQREYIGSNDQTRMIKLARTTAADNIHVIDLPYRLSSWALDNPANVGLWVDVDGGLVAWAVMQTPFWVVDYVLQPALEPELHPLILAWLDQRAQALHGTPYGLPSWYVNVFADQTSRRRALEQFGFTDQSNAGEDSWSKVWMERPAALPVPEYRLPRGFTVRSLAGKAEIEAYVTLHRSVFQTKNMSVGWRNRSLNHPGYTPDLDVVVVAPTGQLAAFCIGWLSEDMHATRCGQVEPLGCLAEFRSYALGRLALCEVLQRLHAHAAHKIYVETDNYRATAFRLYESLGFSVARQVLVYRKDYQETSA